MKALDLKAQLAAIDMRSDQAEWDRVDALLEAAEATPPPAHDAAAIAEVAEHLLAFTLRCAADNPAAIGSQRAAMELLERLGIEDRDGWFFANEEADLADARTRLRASLAQSKGEE